MSRTLLALVACGLLAAPVTAEEYNRFVKLVHVDSGKVLAVVDDSDEAGAKMVLAKDDGSKGQNWKIEHEGDYYKIINRKSGKVLDVDGRSKLEEAKIIQWHDKENENNNQRWSWEGTGKERRLKSKLSNLVLEVGDEDLVVQRRSELNVKSQLWRVVMVD
jgi:hypothetical protein